MNINTPPIELSKASKTYVQESIAKDPLIKVNINPDINTARYICFPTALNL